MSDSLNSVIKSIRKKSMRFVTSMGMLPSNKKTVCVYLGESAVSDIKVDVEYYLKDVARVAYDEHSMTSVAYKDIKEEDMKALHDIIVNSVSGGVVKEYIDVYFITSMAPANNIWKEIKDMQNPFGFIDEINEFASSVNVEIKYSFIAFMPFGMITESNRSFFNDTVLPVLKSFYDHNETRVLHIKQITKDNYLDISESIAFYIVAVGADIFKPAIKNAGTYGWANFYLFSNSMVDRCVANKIYNSLGSRQNKATSPRHQEIYDKIYGKVSQKVADIENECMSNITENDCRYMPVLFTEDEVSGGGFLNALFHKRSTSTVYTGDFENAYASLIKMQEAGIEKRKNKAINRNVIKDIIDSVVIYCDRFDQLENEKGPLIKAIVDLMPVEKRLGVHNSDNSYTGKYKGFVDEKRDELRKCILNEILDHLRTNRDEIKKGISDKHGVMMGYVRDYMNLLFLGGYGKDVNINEDSLSFETNCDNIADFINDDDVSEELRKIDFVKEVDNYIKKLCGIYGNAEINPVSNVKFGCEAISYDVSSDPYKGINAYVAEGGSYDHSQLPQVVRQDPNIKQDTIFVLYYNYNEKGLPWE